MSKLLTKLSVAALVAMSMNAFAENSVEVDGETVEVATPVVNNQPTSGVVNFNGLVTANTCYVAANSRDITVNLPTVKANELAKNSASAKGNTPFSITLDGCPVAGYHTDAETGEKKSSVSIFFDGNAGNVTNDGTLKNAATAANAAKHVELQLFNEAGSAINLKADKATQAQLIKKAFAAGEEQVTFKFAAEYVGKGNVEPGFVKSNVPFQIDYQ